MKKQWSSLFQKLYQETCQKPQILVEQKIVQVSRVYGAFDLDTTMGIDMMEHRIDAQIWFGVGRHIASEVTPANMIPPSREKIYDY